MGLKTGGTVSVHTSHCTHVKSHLTLRKRVGPCGRWWWMTVHQYTEGNSLKPTKMCSLENGLWLLRYAGRPTPKMIKRWSGKPATKVKILTPQIKGERWERERDKKRPNKQHIPWKHLDVEYKAFLECCQDQELWNQIQKCYKLHFFMLYFYWIITHLY